MDINLDTVLSDHRTGQDATQLGSFVLGGRTEYGTYKQAVRELYKRIRGLRQMITDRDVLLLDIEDKKEEIETLEGRDKQRAELKLRSMYGQLEEAERGIVDTKREAALFYREAALIKSKIGELTEEKRADLDREEWKWWHLKRAAMDKLTSGRVSEVVLKNLISLPISERQEWLSVIKDDQALINLLETSEYGMKVLSSPTEEEIKLIETEVDNNECC